MKRLSLYLFLLLFTLQTPSQADDIRDFQIEGMSIGDSMLDYISESEIGKYFYSKSKKYAITAHKINNAKVYDKVGFHYKTNDKKFIIHDIHGKIYFPNNIEACYKREKEIIEELESLFPSARKDAQGKLIHKSDNTGKSTYTYTAFYLNNGTVGLECTDWGKKITSEKGWTDGLRVFIQTKEFMHWIRNEAR